MFAKIVLLVPCVATIVTLSKHYVFVNRPNTFKPKVVKKLLKLCEHRKKICAADYCV